ncbi:TlpA family protein disulfide reductase [Alicyclobacillus acidiphilus]|uniref:TlpA family protein disulfide reductase n=1 Tax=Alicyclobacillus acidiphilus TaxID=182455 RepID=UPI0008297BAA|nr:hypothetical protein [Alicyclobacillus acidiphilus]
MQKTIVWLAGLLAAGCLTGCSIAWNDSHAKVQATTQQISFQNRTDELVGPVDTKLDPTPVKQVDYTKIPVVDGEGRHVSLDARKQPVLFVAYWCPHCQRTLKLLSQEFHSLKQKPILVCVGYSQGTTLRQAVAVQHQEQTALHLAAFQVYYDLNPKAGDVYAPAGYPTLVYQANDQLLSLYGEHTAAIWRQVLRA